MPLLNIVDPQDATGQVKEVYDMMMEKAQVVPKPLQLLSPSPPQLGVAAQSIDYYFNHPNLGFELLAHIRLLVARFFNYEYCINFNAGILQMLTEMSDDQLETTFADPAQAALNDKDKALLLFVLKAVKTPETTTPEDVADLRELGWNDQDILDATCHGADMMRHGTLFKAFKMDS
jgi:hypothetical protein